MGSRQTVTRCVFVSRRTRCETQFSGEFQWPQEGVGQPAPRARSARGHGRPRRSASGSQVLVTRCVWWLPDHEFTLSLPSDEAAAIYACCLNA
jgi:hypothetical protein